MPFNRTDWASATRTDQVCLGDDMNPFNAAGYPVGDSGHEEYTRDFTRTRDRRQSACRHLGCSARECCRRRWLCGEPGLTHENALTVDGVGDDIPLGRVAMPVALRRLPRTTARKRATETRKRRAAQLLPGLRSQWIPVRRQLSRVNLGDSGASIRMRELAGVWGFRG